MVKPPNALHGFTMSFDAFFSALQGEDRVAGVVIEYDRVRYAEFRAAKKGEASHAGRVLIGEGAVSLPEGTIRAGALAKPDALTEALKKLRKEGKPRPLATPQIILAVPIVRLVGNTVQIPAGVSGSEAEGALRLEIESMIPFPLEEAYLDWQPLTPKEGETQQEFLFGGARITEIEPYIEAAERAGMGVVAVEPVTLSIARGMEAPEKVTYIANIYPDALLGAAIDEKGEVRYFHHRSLPPISVARDNPLEQPTNDGRAQRLMLELAAFIRFLRDQFAGHEQELIIDGDLQENEVAQMQGLSESLGIPVRLDLETHTLSRAAARGVALRGMMPRSKDTMVSLMAEGTEVVYAQKQAGFFFGMALRTFVLGAAFVSLLMAGTWGFLLKIEQDAIVALDRQERVIPEDSLAALEKAKEVNEAVRSKVALLEALPVPFGMMSALRTITPDGIKISRLILQTKEGVIEVNLSVEARDGSALKQMQTALRDSLATNAEDVEVDPSILVSSRRDIPHVFSFDLREGAIEALNTASIRNE